MGSLGHPNERSCPAYLQPVCNPSRPFRPPTSSNAFRNDFVEIMEMLDKRLNDKGKNWRHVFKVSVRVMARPQLSRRSDHHSCRRSRCSTTVSTLALRMSLSTSATMSISSRRSRNSSTSTSTAKTRAPTSAKRQRTSQISSRTSPVSVRSAEAARICVTA